MVTFSPVHYIYMCLLFHIECYEEVRALCLERGGTVYMYRIVDTENIIYQTGTCRRD